MKRSFKRGGVDVVVDESGDDVTLELNGHAIEVAKIDGQYHSQTAHQFRTFDTLDEVVDTLLHNEGRYWQLESAPGAQHGGHGMPPGPVTPPAPEHGHGDDQ